MVDILNRASMAIRQAQLHAPTGDDQDALGGALDLIEGELPNLLDLMHDLAAAYRNVCADARNDPLLRRVDQLIGRVEGSAIGQDPAALEAAEAADRR